MLTPEQLQSIPDYFVNLYQELEEFIIADFVRRIGKAGAITETAEWQAIRAKEIGMALEGLEKEIKRVKKLSQREIDQLMKEVAELSLENDRPIYENQGKLAPSLEKSETLQNYVKAAQEQTKGELFNMTQSLGFARKVGNKIEYLPMYEFYNKALDMAQFQVSTGVLDYNTAIRNAVKEISKSGLRWIDYESGWHNRVDVAARRAVMTGVNQMASKMNDQVVKDLGAEYAEVTAHAGARPSHAEWQGKVLKIIGSAPGYPNLARTTGLGTGLGLCGWNCRHNYYAFFPGISVPTYTEKELEHLDNDPFEYEGKTYNHYEATQQQRKIETAMRQSKIELIGYDALGDKEAFTTASIKLQRQKQFYKEFSNTAGLPLQNERHQVISFDKSISQKSVWANKQAVKKYSMSHINSVNSPNSKNVIKDPNSSIVNNVYRFDDRKKADQLFRPQTEKLWPRLTAPEKNAAYQYTMGSGKFNRPMRGYDKTWSNFKGVGNVPLDNENGEKYIHSLKDAIDKSYIPEDVWLFRGSDKQSLAGLLGIDKSKIIPSKIAALNKKFSGKKVLDPAFFSTGIATDAGFHDIISYEILAPKGTKGIYAEPFSYYGDTNTTGNWDGKQTSKVVGSEAEIILQAKTRFEIVEIKEVSGKVTVVMKVIGVMK